MNKLNKNFIVLALILLSLILSSCPTNNLGDDYYTVILDPSIDIYDVENLDISEVGTIEDEIFTLATDDEIAAMDANDYAYTGTDDAADVPFTSSSEEFKHFIGRGYDYFGEYASESSCLDPVLDYDKLITDKMVTLDTSNSQTYSKVAGKNETEMASSYSINAKVDVGLGGFSGSLKTNFAQNATKKAATAFASTQIIISRYTERLKATYYNERKVKTAKLRDYMTTDAKEALDEVASIDDALDFFAAYGTHVVTNTILGGRYEFNSFTESQEVTSATKFSAAMEVKVKKIFGASVEYTQEEKYKNAAMNSKDKGVVAGGSSGSQGAILSKLDTANWKAWATSLDSSENWTIAAFPKSNGLGTPALLPVWELVDTEAANHDAVVEYFRNAITRLSEEKKNKPVVAKYLKDMRRYTDSNPPEVKYFDIAPGQKEPFYLIGDTFNRGSGQSRDCYLYYNMTGDPAEAITEINVQKGQTPREDWVNVGDMNWGNPGKPNVYLSYEKGGEGKQPITGIIQYVGDLTYISKTVSSDAGFTDAVFSIDDFTKLSQDINVGNGGKYIYLGYTRTVK